MRQESTLTRIYKEGLVGSFPLHIAGYVLLAEAFLMFLVMVLFGLDDGEIVPCMFASLIGAILGASSIILFRTTRKVRASMGIFTITLVWAVAIAYGCVPYVIYGFSIPDALFESISGFTTTGMSIIDDVAGLSNPILIWRAMTGWAGGIGFIIMFCLLLKYFGLGGRNIFVSDGLDVTSSKSITAIRTMTLKFVAIYAALTSILGLILFVLGNGFIDSVCISMSTISTTGFSTLNDDLTGMSMSSKIAVGGFLILSAMNFITLFDAITGARLKSLVRDTEIRHMVYWFIGATIVLMVILHQAGAKDWDATDVVDTALMALSIGTTTGFVFHNFTWPTVAMLFLCILALVGGCRESPTGGIKIARLSLFFRNMRNTISTVGFPNETRTVSFGGRYVDDSLCYSALTTILIFIMTAAVGTLAISLTGVDVMDSFYLCISSLTTTGTGLYSVGSVASIPGFAQAIMCVLMWLGRMEITLVLVMFTSAFWKDFGAIARTGFNAFSNRIRRT